jgi:dUTP pyrophosphatase
MELNNNDNTTYPEHENDSGYYSDYSQYYPESIIGSHLSFLCSRIINWIYSFMSNTILKVKLTNIYSVVPTKADPGSAGYDVYSVEEKMILPRSRELVNIGISTEFSKHYYLRCAPRSGLSVKGIDVGAGVIDSSYRGEIKVLLINNSESKFYVNTGDRIAQLILERVVHPTFELSESLGVSERSDKGFGSSGK